MAKDSQKRQKELRKRAVGTRQSRGRREGPGPSVVTPCNTMGFLDGSLRLKMWCGAWLPLKSHHLQRIPAADC